MNNMVIFENGFSPKFSNNSLQELFSKNNYITKIAFLPFLIVFHVNRYSL